ncbi:MAG: cobalamin-binding protein [Candidatus Bathyarchaeota archaeon]|nr:cobalamin-binding protein [Candidatus Bathyarchaeota archaeon]
MNTKYVLAGIIIAVLIISVVGLYIFYPQLTGNSDNYIVTVIDDSGVEIGLEAYPESLISLAPSITEIIYAIDAGDLVIGVTDFDNYPYDFSAWIEAGNMTSVGSFDNPNLEVIASLNPDLILATGGVLGETITTLRDLSYTVVVLDPTTINGVIDNIELAGKLTNKNAEATAIIDDINTRIAAVEAIVATADSIPTVYYEVWYDTTGVWTAGSQAWQNELIELAGGVNLFADQDLEYFSTGSEQVITLNPDVMIVPEEHGVNFWESFEAIKDRPGWESISALQNDRMYDVDSDLIARGGPRIAEAIETLAAVFHPELF